MTRFWWSARVALIVVAVLPSAAPAQAPRPGSVQPWKNNFFDNDFSYKRKPDAPSFFGEQLKDVALFSFADEDWTGSVGGEIRHRYHDERNRLVPGGPGLNSYNQFRWRQYVDVKAGDLFRVYFEGIDASTFGEELPETAIDVNRWDVQNAFVDLNLWSEDKDFLKFRYGRQELLYGAQRLVSPLDFGTTRRNFEGYKVMTQAGDWKVDAFTTRPVNTGAGNGPLARFDNESDSPDQSRTFSGVYSVYSGFEKQTWDFYWLWLREQDERAQPPRFPDGSRHTVGARWAGERPAGENAWIWDVEGAYQFGHDEFTETVRAGFAAGNLGYQLKNLPWTPKLMAVGHYGSGDDDPTDSENNTFSTLFPLGHAYWGVIDNLGGANLIDYSVQMQIHPARKIDVIFAYHWFELASEQDVLYNVALAPLGTPDTGSKIGEEFDVVLNYTYSPNFAMQLQYAEFFYGTFVDNNLPRDDARQFFVQSAFRY